MRYAVGSCLSGRDDFDVPFCAAHVWAWFWDMDCATRLTSADISAWCHLHDVRLRSWEISALRVMDDARDEWRRKPEAEKKMMPATPENLLTALRSKQAGDPKKQVRKK